MVLALALALTLALPLALALALAMAVFSLGHVLGFVSGLVPSRGLGLGATLSNCNPLRAKAQLPKLNAISSSISLDLALALALAGPGFLSGPGHVFGLVPVP